MTERKQRIFWTLVTIVVLMFLGVPFPVTLGALAFTYIVRKTLRFIAKKSNIQLKS